MMLKKTILAVALVLSGTAWSATPAIGGYWQGETVPGRLVDSSGNLKNLTQVSDPGNPGTPSPVFEGSLWLGGGGTGQYEIPVSTISDYSARNVVEFGTRFNSAAGTAFNIIWYDGGSFINDLQSVDNNDGTFQFSFVENGVSRFSVAITTGANHHVRVQFPQTGDSDGSVTVDGGLVASGFTRSTAMIPTDHFEILNISGYDVYMDGVMVSQGWSDVYPGPANPTPTPSPTVSPTYSITPTFTVSPTSSITPSSTPSPSNSPSPTATPAVSTPSNVRVGTLQPNNTIGLFWDVDPAATKWLVYLNGAQTYDIQKSQVAVPTPGTYFYLMQSLPVGAAVSLTMSSGAPGKRYSDTSLPVLFNTALAPFSYKLPMGISSADRFAVTGDGRAYSLGSPVQSYSIEVCGEGGSLASWDVLLQGSLDGVHFTTFMTHSSGSLAECATTSSGASLFPYSYVRVSCDSLGLGTASDALVLVNGLP